MRPSAAVTGWAWRTPLGSEVDAVVGRLLAGERAARPCLGDGRLGAPLADRPAPSPHRKFVGPLGLLAMQTAAEAARRAGCEGGPRVALFAAVGGLRVSWADTLPCFEGLRPDGEGAWDDGLRKLHPFWLLKHLSNNAHAMLSADLGARGEGATYGGANAGAQALCAALRCLAEDAADAAVVMAYDTLLEPEALVELEGAGALFRGGLEALAAPYDSAAAGFVPGEATAAVVLEPAARAGSRALARVSAAEGAGPEAEARVLAELGPSEVFDGAGRAHLEADALERTRAAQVCRDAALTCVGAGLGHLGAAAGLAQAIALAACLRLGRLPPIAGLRRPAAGALRPVREAEATLARSALALSAGEPGLAGAVRVEVP